MGTSASKCTSRNCVVHNSAFRISRRRSVHALYALFSDPFRFSSVARCPTVPSREKKAIDAPLHKPRRIPQRLGRLGPVNWRVQVTCRSREARRQVHTTEQPTSCCERHNESSKPRGRPSATRGSLMRMHHQLHCVNLPYSPLLAIWNFDLSSIRAYVLYPYS